MTTHLRAAGVSVILDDRGAEVPSLLHWGRDLGPLGEQSLAQLAVASVPAVPPSSIDSPLRLSLIPTIGEGWTGRPALSVWRSPASPAAAHARALRLTSRTTDTAQPRSGTEVSYLLGDAAAAIEVRLDLELTPQGVLRSRLTVTNTGDDDLGVDAAIPVLPIPQRAGELLDFSGLWAREGRPIRRTLEHGVHARESRHGRGGHDSAFVLSAGTPGFGWETGEIWAVHAAWSGDTSVWAERSSLGPSTLAAGELLAPGEVILPPGGSYTSPWTVAVYSRDGLNGISDRVHPWVRSWSAAPAIPRPVVLNTWEAVYFRQSLAALVPLVEAARDVGVERFVLDDGWFRGRSDDRRALGDWTVDATTWPDGLGPLIDLVHEAGMQFGLWVEPEMTSADSDAAREHPEWVLGGPDDPEWRFQRVLDLTVPDAADHVFRALDALLDSYDIAYLKWDHNRDLLVAGSHDQTEALYALIDRLRAAHPGVEIESCASGGARLDLGILSRVQRVWPSDTNDPLERQRIVASAGILLPPEYLGAHVGAERAHTTARHADASFRFATALFGSAGIEWDLSRATPAEREQVGGWVSEHKRLRGLLHSGRTVRADTADPAQVVHGVVDESGHHAVFSIAMVGSAAGALPPPVRFPGLAPDVVYEIRALDIGGAPVTIADQAPPWLAAGGARLAGGLLAETGLPMPLLAPEQALVLELRAIDS